jgi:hypothetical protein
MIKLIDILKEMYPPYKADMVSKVRYKASDTFTNDPKVAIKKGYLENNTSGKAAPYGSGYKKIKEALTGGLSMKDDGRIDLEKAIPELEQINSYIKEMGSSSPVIYREAKLKQHHVINKLTTGDRDKYRGITLGAKTILDELGIKDPVFATFSKGVGIFGESYIVILKNPYKIYQSDKVFDLAVDTNPVQYKETNIDGGLTRRQTGTLTPEEEVAKGKKLAKTYKETTDIKPLPGKEGWEILIDTPEYYLINIGVIINLAGKHSGYQVKDASKIQTYGQLNELMSKLINYWKWSLKNKK